MAPFTIAEPSMTRASKFIFFTLISVTLIISLSVNASSFSEQEISLRIDSVLSSDTRRDGNIPRDVYRNPKETLLFFGMKPEMTVVEIWPGGGWYTEIIAPFLKGHGTYYGAHFDPLSENRRYIDALERFQSRFENHPEKFGHVVVSAFNPPEELLIAPEGSADMVLTFRNLHNWMRKGEDNMKAVSQAFFKALKPGGILGVVEHRVRPVDGEKTPDRHEGYVSQDYAIRLFETAGFVFEESSEINANPKDSTRHPKGVWTLPPSLRLGEQDREKYLAIGESDRMTLRFRKPE